MCGIAGFIDFNKHLAKEDLINMSSALIHRGPDGAGHEFIESQHAAIGFGHRRLSIIDLSEGGKQPKEKHNCLLTFNGEIYNYHEIRQELEKDGYVFSTGSDTEVVLSAYHKYGPKCVDHFIGMFAFAIYDRQNNLVRIFRDRTGVKPMFLYRKEGLLLFASELKSFHQISSFDKSIKEDTIPYFLQHGYIPTPHSIFKFCRKLVPGHYLEINLSTTEEKEIKYWDAYDFYNQPQSTLSEEEILEETERLLVSGCKYRMVADVPVGIFLSGGYDSSAVTALLQKDATQKLKTFTIGFEDAKFNEALHAKKVAEHLGTDHTEYYCSVKEAQEIIPQLSSIYDEPFGDSSAIPTILVSQLAKKDVKVALSADGGDEVFVGYDRHRALQKLYKKTQAFSSFLKYPIAALSPLQNIVGSTFFNNQNVKNGSKLLELMADPTAEKHLTSILRHLTKAEQQALFTREFKPLQTFFSPSEWKREVDFINRIVAIEYKTFLNDDILAKVDRASMSVGLEGREPLLDHRLLEFMATIPSSEKFKNGIQKYHLKKITHKYIPQEIMNRPKMGFGVPIMDWLRTDLSDITQTYLSDKILQDSSYLNASLVKNTRDEFLNKSKAKNYAWLYNLIQLEMWKEKWL